MIGINTVVTIIIAVLLFGVIILIHELGHFTAAKIFGVKVNEFALGMGPTIFHFGKGETKYALRAFPIGGFCAMEGEDEASGDPRAFNNKKVWQRMIIVVAGALMNVVLGFILMVILTAQSDSFKSTTVADVGKAIQVESGASFQAGDEILSINGYRTFNDYDFNFAISRSGGQSMTFEVKRNGEKIVIEGVTVDFSNVGEGDAQYAFLVQGIDKNFFTVLEQSAISTVSIVRVVWASFIDLITGKYGFEALSGPVGTAEIIGEAASQGVNFVESLNNVLWIMALITVNLGVFNLLPIPALDGGRLLFLIVEGFRRKPINPKYEGWVHAAGFVLLIGIMIAVTFKDIMNLIT